MTMTTASHAETADRMRGQLRELRERARKLHEDRRLLTHHIGECVVAGKATTRLHVERRHVDDSLEGTYAAINVLEGQLRNCGKGAASVFGMD